MKEGVYFRGFLSLTLWIFQIHRLKNFALQIGMIYLVLKVHPEDSREAQTARVLLYKLFYDQTEQGLTQFLLNLFRSFDTHKQPKRFTQWPLSEIYIIYSVVYLLFKFEVSEYASKDTESLLYFADMCLVETFLIRKSDAPHVFKSQLRDIH